MVRARLLPNIPPSLDTKEGTAIYWKTELMKPRFEEFHIGDGNSSGKVRLETIGSENPG